MTRTTPPRGAFFSNPMLLGFDEVDRLLEQISKTGNDGYPPYNIEQITQSDGKIVIRLVFAVAGFREEELDVTVEENQLLIRGKQNDDAERVYLHRGIAARQFQRSFVLADGMEVGDAKLKNGLLSIDLSRPQAERIVKKIKISRAE